MTYYKITPSPQVYILGLITIALFLAATNIQGGWLYIIDSLLVSLMIFSFITPINQARKLKFSRNFNKSVYEGDNVDVTLEIGNDSKRIISFIEIRDPEIRKKSDKPVIISTKDSWKFFIELMPGEKNVFNYTLMPELRGVYLFEKIIVSSYGPFGLFKFSKSIQLKDELLVFPIMPILNSLFLSGLQGVGYRYSSQTRNNPDANIPYNVREYRKGDSKKLVHWKTTARFNKLMVKEFESEQSLSLQIIFDTEKGCNLGQGKESNFEYLIKFAGSILKFCIDRNFKIEFLFYESDKVQKLTEVTPWKQVMDTFAYLDTYSKLKVRNLLKEKEIDFNSIIIPFFLKPDEKDIELLSELHQQNYSIIPIFAEINSFDKNYFPIKASFRKMPGKL